MKYRKLKYNGQRVKEASYEVSMTIRSKCPKKWAFVDMETGQIWVHNSRLKKSRKEYPYTFYVADKDAIRALDNIMTEIKVKELGYEENIT